MCLFPCLSNQLGNITFNIFIQSTPTPLTINTHTLHTCTHTHMHSHRNSICRAFKYSVPAVFSVWLWSVTDSTLSLSSLNFKPAYGKTWTTKPVLVQMILFHQAALYHLNTSWKLYQLKKERKTSSEVNLIFTKAMLLFQSLHHIIAQSPLISTVLVCNLKSMCAEEWLLQNIPRVVWRYSPKQLLGRLQAYYLRLTLSQHSN